MTREQLAMLRGAIAGASVAGLAWSFALELYDGVPMLLFAIGFVCTRAGGGRSHHHNPKD